VSRSAYDISVREYLQHKGTGITIALALFGVAIIVAGYYFWPQNHKVNYTERFYSDDDGQTYFKDSVYNFAPFDHNGKVANIAIVCTDGRQNFVAYLERYTSDAKKELQSSYDSTSTVHGKTLDMMAFAPISRGGTEWKLPGKDNSWNLVAKTQTPEIRSPSGGDIQIVQP
jgi:hypothetical protein